MVWPMSYHIIYTQCVHTGQHIGRTLGVYSKFPNENIDRLEKPWAYACTPRKNKCWTSLVVQWLRICLPMQGKQVWSLVWEYFTCGRATKPIYHNYWSHTLDPVSPRAGALQQGESPQWEACAPSREKAWAPPWRPVQPKTNKQKFFKSKCYKCFIFLYVSGPTECIFNSH